MIANELNADAPLEIDIIGNYNSSGRQGNLLITLRAVSPITNTNLKLRVAVVESNINWLAPNGTRWHNQTFRDMSPSTSGIPVTIAEGDTLEFSQTFNLPSPLNPSNCEIIVFLQSDSGRRILQGAKISVSSLPPPYELDPFSLIAPADYDTIETCYPSMIWHSSDDPDSGYAISYRVSLSLDPSFIGAFNSDWLSDTTWQTPICLLTDSLYYWRVMAANGHAPDIYSNQLNRFVVVEPGCPYLPGDVNGSNSYNGLDITYGVSYLKGGPLPNCPQCDCPDSFCGDVNGSCTYNGLDITYGVAYLKGGNPPVHCQDCPPIP